MWYKKPWHFKNIQGTVLFQRFTTQYPQRSCLNKTVVCKYVKCLPWGLIPIPLLLMEAESTEAETAGWGSSTWAMPELTAFCNLLLQQKEWGQSSLSFPCSSCCQILPYSMPKDFLLAIICCVSYRPCFVDPEVMDQEGFTDKTHQKRAQDNRSVS